MNGRFEALCQRITAALPCGLNAIVAPTFVGFTMLNGLTFTVDILLLTLLHDGIGVPLPAAVTAAYASALALGYFLNRILNFRSPPAATQAAVYAAAVLANYLLFILGLVSGLTALGADYHIARVVAGACEAAFMYSAMRWLVFRRPAPRK